ncbi:aldose epimerase family protein [Colwellia sp. 1_MG-2023]|uniref:aldose epimerase family protein n=1 Tax=Colwellia sp. 1_MG-2023 TaxID=3062649 RepID=UPI0026E2A4D2|nr:aldose epimerase family protein [Colwellia sp. 1_MG-2023]MDO6446387.1 aldose epimerase family protein [Colwellia sp. 1_MG-2023]
MNDLLSKVTLTNANGMEVELLNFGARISSIKFPVKGELTEMTVVYDDAEKFLSDEYYLGATCGPVCNRLSNASFFIGDQTYYLSENDNENCLHGGEDNFALCMWEIEASSRTTSYVKFLFKTSDLDRGFPGNNHFTVEYQLTESNQLVICYSGTSDRVTPMNLTNHAYFNLGQSSCMDLTLNVRTSSFLTRFDNGIPTGEIQSTKVLENNLRAGVLIKDFVDNCDYPQVIKDNGIDHCFILDNGPLSQEKSTLYNANNKVLLSVFTDQPTMQIYTGNYLAQPFEKHAGICLECHGFVDAPNIEHFASIHYEPTQTYKSKIIYGFECFA